MDETKLFIELLAKGFVDSDKIVVPRRENDLYEAYPAFNKGGLKPDRVIKGDKKTKVGIRPERYSEAHSSSGGLPGSWSSRVRGQVCHADERCLQARLEIAAREESGRGRRRKSVVAFGRSCLWRGLGHSLGVGGSRLPLDERGGLGDG